MTEDSTGQANLEVACRGIRPTVKHQNYQLIHTWHTFAVVDYHLRRPHESSRKWLYASSQQIDPGQGTSLPVGVPQDVVRSIQRVDVCRHLRNVAQMAQN